MIVSCWNIEWHDQDSWEGRQIIQRLSDGDPEIICCPEAFDDFLGEGWNGIFSEPDYGYPMSPGRRKVTLWSKRRWSDVDNVGSPDLPTGRYVSGITETSLGKVRVIGVCVPWKGAHVSSGRKDRQSWADHVSYLRALRPVLSELDTFPTIIIGDLNQRIPRRYSPEHVHSELLATLDGIDIWTEGGIAGLEHQPVCHVGGSGHFAVASLRGYSRNIGGRTVSDHDGIEVGIGLKRAG